MEEIKNDSMDIYPIFWEEFDIYQSQYTLAVKHKQSEQSEDKNSELKQKITNMFDLLIFILNRIKDIYSNNLNNSTEILNVMCVYSCLTREIGLIGETHFSNKGTDFLEEFIDIFNNFDMVINIILDSEANNLKRIEDVLHQSIDKANKFYLKVIQCI